MSPGTIVTLTCEGCGKTYCAPTFAMAQIQLDCHRPCRVAVAREIAAGGLPQTDEGGALTPQGEQEPAGRDAGEGTGGAA